MAFPFDRRRFGQIITEMSLPPGQSLPSYLSTYSIAKTAGGTIYTPSSGGQKVFIRDAIPVATTSAPSIPSQVVQPASSTPQQTVEVSTQSVQAQQAGGESPGIPPAFLTSSASNEAPSQPMSQTEVLRAGFSPWMMILLAGAALMMLSNKRRKT